MTLDLLEQKLAEPAAPMLPAAGEAKARNRSDSIDIRDYLRDPIVLSPEQTNRTMQKLFNSREAECAVVCDSSGVPLGLVMKDRFFRHLGKLYGSSLYYDKSVVKLMDGDALQADLAMSTQQIIDLAFDREEAYLYDCVIVKEGGRLAGIVSVGDLLHISRHMQRTAIRNRIDAVLHTRTMLDRIGEMVGRVMTSAETGAEWSSRMIDMTFDGQNQLKQVSEAFRYLTEITTEQERQIAELEQRTKAVSGILLSIREIAEQSNYLAVNAAIEAARAGAHGKGFAVVTDEVNKLSAQTKQSAAEIAAIIRGIGQSMQQTADLVRSGREQSLQSAKQVEQTKAVFETLFHAVTDNRKSVGQIRDDAGTAQNEADRMRQDMHRLAEEMASSASPEQDRP